MFNALRVHAVLESSHLPQRFIAGDTLGKGRCGGMPHTILIRHVLLNVVCGWDDLQHMVRRSDYLFDAL